MGARTRLLTGLVLIVVIALAPLAGAACDTLCAPTAVAAHAPTCHEAATGGDRLDSGSHSCPESHAVLQSSQALLTIPRGAVDELAPAPLALVLRSALLVADPRAGFPSGSLPAHRAPAHVSPILRI
ncbi:MAG TPA: hypothetical protein VF198_16460 [Vicinamibacterales bacterium]